MIPSPAVLYPLGLRGAVGIACAPGSCHVAEQPVPMRGCISPRLQCSHSLSPLPSYQIKLTLVGDPYQFSSIGLGEAGRCTHRRLQSCLWLFAWASSAQECGWSLLLGDGRLGTSLIQTHPSYKDALTSASGLWLHPLWDRPWCLPARLVIWGELLLAWSLDPSTAYLAFWLLSWQLI